MGSILPARQVHCWTCRWTWRRLERFAHGILSDSGDEIAIVFPAIDFVGVLLRTGPPATMCRELGEAARIHHPIVDSEWAFAIANCVNGNHGSEKGRGGSRMVEANEELEHTSREKSDMA
jgi:hypothetical protein